MTITVNQDMLNQIVDDVDDGWDDNTITFSLDVDPGSYGSPFESLDTVPMSQAQKDAIVEAMELWDDVITRNISYVYNNDDEDIIVNLTNDLPANVGGRTYSTLHSIWPNDADVFLRPDAIIPGNEYWSTAIHEFGHALGLQHPGDYDASDGNVTYANDAEHLEDTAQFTIMSYFEASEYNAAATWWSGQVLTPMIYDILAIQAYYGVDTTTRLGDTTYGFNNTSGRAVFSFHTDPSRPTPVFTIWDAGGARDRLDASGYASAQRIDLSEGSYSDIGGLVANIGIAFGTFIEDAVGGTGADRIDGNALGNMLDGGEGTDTLFGFDGSDTVIGGNGGDLLYGDGGNDTLVGGGGGDLLNGGTGFDTAEYSAAGGENITIRALLADPTFGRWTVTGAAQATGDILTLIEAFRFGEGNDRIATAGGTAAFSFNLDGRGGNDTILGGLGRDTLVGGLGRDELRPGAGLFHVVGGLVGGPYDQTGAETRAQDDVLGLDRTGATAAYSLALGGFDGGSFTDSEGSTGRGIARLDFIGGAGSDGITGGLGADSIDGREGADNLSGFWGHDLLTGGEGDDYLYGGDGNDTLRGGTGYDRLYGGYGDDRIEAGGGADAAVYGEAGNDLLIGTDDAEWLTGGSENDTLQGFGGADNLSGGDGNDVIQAGLGSDFVNPGLGVENLDGGAGDVDTLTIARQSTTLGVSFYLNGPAGSDGTVAINFETVTYGAGSGNDTVRGWSNADNLSGNDGHDVLEGMAGDDYLFGGEGNDTLRGGTGYDRLYGGNGDDRIETGSGADAAVYGDAGNDLLIGTDEAEWFTGGADNDTIHGFGGADNLSGGDGNDVIRAGLGSDFVNPGLGVENLDGGAGDVDTLTIGRQSTTLGVSFYLNGPAGTDGTVAINFETVTYGAGSGNDTVRGWSNADYLTGNDGHDVLEGMAGDDYLYGGEGNDTLRGGTGYDRMYGGNGNDRIEAGGGADAAVYGDAGDDLLIGTNDAEWFTGGADNDTIQGFGGVDNISGDAGNDVIQAGLGSDFVNPGLGIETVDGGVGDFDTLTIARQSTVLGVSFFLNGPAGSDGTVSRNFETVAYSAGSGNDTVRGWSNADNLTGNNGHDVLEGMAGDDYLYGGEGNDTLRGGTGYDRLYGGNGDDRIETGGGADAAAYGDAGNDLLIGTDDAEWLMAGSENDTVQGFGGVDNLYGDSGDDLLQGGLGSDVLVGGAGLDAFLFDTALNAATNVDRIVDFVVADDTIRLDDAIFAALGAPGVLAAAAFRIGAAAADANDRVVYDAVTGALLYDSDGTGAAAAVQFAVVTTGLALTSADIVVA